jgi:heat shock protein HslJ
MKRMIVVGLVLAAILAGCAAPTPAAPAAATDMPAVPTKAVENTTVPAAQSDAPGYKDATFIIEGTPVPLKDGVNEMEAAPGSATKTTTRYFGNEATGDLNGDGKADVAFIITQDTGGSGTFYYVVAALSSANGYTGTNAMLLGDRVAPQNTAIQDAMILVNYVDRKPDEPMSAKPSVGVSKYFKVVDGKLVEVNSASQITNKPWTWVKTQMNDGKVTTPNKPDAFTLTFKDDGTVSGTTDCNNFAGKYAIDGNKITFSQFASTMMACEGSQEQEFTKSLSQVDQYMMNGNNLVLQIKLDSGSMIFQ